MFWQLVGRQSGVVSRAQALEAGWTHRMIDRAVARGEFDLVLPAVMRLRGSPSTREQALMAVSLWLGDAGAISGLTAGSIWTLARVPVSDAITVSSLTRRSPRPSILVKRARLEPGHVVRHRGLTVTSPARTLVDLAATLTSARLESAVEDAFHRRLCLPADVADVLASSSTAKGRRRLAEILAARGEGAALNRELEVRVARLIRGAAMPPAKRQHVVNVGGIDWSIDFAWPDRRVGVECDGYEHHGTSREAFDQDRLKAAALASVGWRIVPVTWTEATRRADRFLERLTSALNAKIAL